MDTNIISQLTSLMNLSSLSGNSSLTSSSETTKNNDDFSILLLSMLSGMNQNSGSNGLSSLLLLPMMTQLLEKLQALDASNSITENQIPGGNPVSAFLTQGYHQLHKGLDYGVKVGTPVKTTMSGKVVYAGWNNEGYGNLVIVENGAYRTYYGHLSSIPVENGQAIQKGSVIGYSGNTGNSTGPHLHYEVRLNGVPVDPSKITDN